MTCYDWATSQDSGFHTFASSDTSLGKCTQRCGGRPSNLSKMRPLPFKGEKKQWLTAVTAQYVCCATMSQQKLLLLTHGSTTLPWSTAWPSPYTCEGTTVVMRTFRGKRCHTHSILTLSQHDSPSAALDSHLCTSCWQQLLLNHSSPS